MNNDEIIRDLMSKYLIEIGIYPSLNCFNYLTECVVAINNRGNERWKIGDIYTEIGKKYKCSIASIDRCLRFGISSCINSVSIPHLSAHFGVNLCKTNTPFRVKDFVSLYVMKIKIALLKIFNR